MPTGLLFGQSNFSHLVILKSHLRQVMDSFFLKADSHFSNPIGESGLDDGIKELNKK
jgi:hypothetical protein